MLKKNIVTKMRQKTVDLRKIVQNALERNVKKYQLQQKQLKDTEKKEKYRVWGELLNTYGYEVEPGAKSMEALNYYTNEMIQIPLDETMTPQENAKKYFDKYSKLKRTKEALDTLLQETGDEIKHLESIDRVLLILTHRKKILVQIKEEMNGIWICKAEKYRRKKSKSQPLVHIIIFPAMDMISMSAKIIFRTMSFLLSLLPAMTGGFMPKDSRDPM